MERPLSKMLSLVYEIEGLLLVAEKHDSDTPQFVFDMLAEKSEKLYALTRMDSAPQAPDTTATTVANNLPCDTRNLPCDDYNSDDTTQHDDGEEPAEIFHSDYVEPERTSQHAAQLGTDRVPDDDSINNNDEQPQQQSLRLDQKLQQHIAQDLRSAFSLNDRFRFRRELFSNNEGEMDDALNLIGTMHSYDEAVDYFYNDLGWDRQNPDVADFMDIVRNHFA